MALIALFDLQGDSELTIPVVFEQNWNILSSERRAAVMHQTTKQQVVYEITTRQLGRHYSNSKVRRNMKLTVNKEKNALFECFVNSRWDHCPILGAGWF